MQDIYSILNIDYELFHNLCKYIGEENSFF